MIVHSLFPKPVGQFKFGRELTEAELSFIKTQKTHKNMGNTTSDDTALFEYKELKDLADFCQKAVDEYMLRIYAPKNEVSLYFTQSWANYTEPGQFHHKHAHPNSFVSGVFYVNADSEKDKIFFYKDGYEQLKLPTDNFNLHNSESWWFSVGTGDLLLFPSSLTHMVEQTQSAETRISISFNTFLKGYVGQDDSLTALHL
jgi:uncharacterized protein (TIGR02466 family)